MKRGVFILFSYFVAINFSIANPSIDSLQYLWSIEKDSAEKYSIGREIANDYIFIDLEKALLYSDTINVFAQKLGGFDYWDARLLRSDILRRMNKEAECLDILLVLIEEAKQEQWKTAEAKAYQIIGLVYSALEEMDKATLNLNRAIDLFSEVGKGGEIFALGDLAEIYLIFNDTLSARNIHLEMVRIAEAKDKPEIIEHILFWMESLTEITQGCSYAEDQLEMVLHYSKIIKNKYSEMFFTIIQMNCLSDRGAFEEVIKVGENIEDKIQSYNDIQLQLAFYKSIRQAYVHCNRWQKAYEIFEKQNQAERFVFNKKKDNSIANLELNYHELQNEKLQQENRLAIKNKQQASDKNTGLIILLILLLLFFLLFWQQKNIKQELEKEKLEHQVWQLQFNPHFFFNALSSIQAFLYQNDSSRAIKAINRLSIMFRKTLNLSEMDWTYLKEELEYINEFVTIHQFMSGDSFRFDIEIDKEIDQLNTQIPPLLIQPILENAIKHGLQGMANNGHLRIILQPKGTTIRVCVSNNGTKFKVNSNVKTSSLGLKITNKRLQTYKLDQRGILIENNRYNDENWVEVSFLLPYKDGSK